MMERHDYRIILLAPGTYVSGHFDEFRGRIVDRAQATNKIFEYSGVQLPRFTMTETSFFDSEMEDMPTSGMFAIVLQMDCTPQAASTEEHVQHFLKSLKDIFILVE